MRYLGSARVSRAGDRVLAIANLICDFANRSAVMLGKVRFGETPKPARETRALPGLLAFDIIVYCISSGRVKLPAQVTGRPFHCQLAGRLVFTTLC